MSFPTGAPTARGGSSDQQFIVGYDEDGRNAVADGDDDVSKLRRPSKRQRVAQRTVEDQLTDQLDPVPGWYQGIMPDHNKSHSHIIFTVFASDGSSLAIVRKSFKQSTYDLGKEAGFLLFLNDQLGLHVCETAVSLQSPKGLIARVFVVDVASQSSDEIDTFLGRLPLQDEGCIFRLSESCGMQIGLPVRTKMRRAPIWIEPVSKKLAQATIEKAVKNRFLQVQSVQDCRWIEGTKVMRGYVNWRGDASGLLWDMLWGGKMVKVKLGKKKGEIKRMQFCPFCSYDCIGEAWPHTKENCSTLQSIEDFKFFKFKDMLPPTSTSTSTNFRLKKTKFPTLSKP